MNDIASRFCIRGALIFQQRFGCGHINETSICTCDSGLSYILQRINRSIFPEPVQLMENIAAVTDYLAAHTADPRATMHIVKTVDGKNCYVDPDGEVWRMYEFVPSSRCLQKAETADEFKSSGYAFGNFLNQLSEFPAADLHETIAGFHDTLCRYEHFHRTLASDPMGRAKDCADEIAFVLAREAEAGRIVNALKCGEIPVRVTHNDTKLNNVLLDYDTMKPLCIIDLDTVMPGSALYDYGDSIRFGASTGAEDETDLDKISVDLELFRAFTEGYLEGCRGSLTERELSMLPVGAKLMTLECGLRFLDDHLDGDHYFRLHRPGQNLDRARTQFKLVRDMEQKWDEMQAIVSEIDALERGRRNAGA